MRHKKIHISPLNFGCLDSIVFVIWPCQLSRRVNFHVAHPPTILWKIVIKWGFHVNCDTHSTTFGGGGGGDTFRVAWLVLDPHLVDSNDTLILFLLLTHAKVAHHNPKPKSVWKEQRESPKHNGTMVWWKKVEITCEPIPTIFPQIHSLDVVDGNWV